MLSRTEVLTVKAWEGQRSEGEGELTRADRARSRQVCLSLAKFPAQNRARDLRAGSRRVDFTSTAQRTRPCHRWEPISPV